MRFLISFWGLLALSGAHPAPAKVFHHFHVVGDDPGAWPAILAAAGFTPGAPGITVIRQGEAAPAEQWLPAVERGGVVILEGDSDLGRALGILPTSERVAVRSIRDARAPKLPIIWQKEVNLAVHTLPEEAKLFARERWRGAPVLAGIRRGEGAVLWVATPPGDLGYERYPYLIHALADLGVEPPLAARNLWAFFDSAYRMRADVEYLAERWRKAGFAALHVAAWQHFEPDPQRDEFLRALIAACHRRAILVYAWLELPHVSERFWEEHPQCREKTALGQDAHLDWRKLVNLADPSCAQAVRAGVRSLLERFDWDGANLAELYFESLEGAGNLARFTPFNSHVNGQFEKLHGLSMPAALREPGELRKLLDFRSQLVHRLQREWLEELAAARRQKSGFEIVLTQIDDRMDPSVRDALGVDSSGVLSLMDEFGFTFLAEDPATIWHLGPQRYPQMWEKYRALARRPERLAVDINIVERYQDVYPTKQQTGTELFQLVHLAAGTFPRVALYFEASILPQDAPFLAAAAARVRRLEKVGEKLVVESDRPVGVRWDGAAMVNGRLWPATDGKTLWLPAGPHVIERAGKHPPLRLTDFNGRLRTASVAGEGIEFSYESESRAMAVFDKKPSAISVDGEKADLTVGECAGGFSVFLPAGQHIVTARR